MRFILIFIVFALAACTSNTTTTQTSKEQKKIKKREKIEVQVTCINGNVANIGNKLAFQYKIKKYSAPDSIKLLIDSKINKTFTPDEEITISTEKENTGNRNFAFHFYWGDSLSTSSVVKVQLLSDIEPTRYTYKVLNKWPHNYRSYTQGLEFTDGYLYEGTGQYNESMLYKMDLDKNEVLQSVNLPNDVFGEGITILNDKLYQITWRSNKGYVYDKSSLTKLYDFTYPTEGWGLTNDGKELIMSDGSENIYYLDTEFLQETKKLQVYDNKGPVKSLNELENINGLIYANVYGTDEIVAFDAHTGKVLKRIDLTGILNKSKLTTPVDVLNGIAWDNSKERLIVTGKWWPYLFEIELIAR